MAMIAPPATATVRAALYCRVSPEYLRQQEDDSLDRQEELTRGYCGEHGWNVVAVFREGHTGAELFEREALRQARDLAQQRGYDVLVVKSVDRFGREPVHQFIVRYELKQVGVRVVFVQDHIPDTDEGEIIHHVLAYGAKKERQRIIERTVTARRERATKRGMPLANGKPPYGYGWADAQKSNFVPVEPEASRAARIWQLAADGMPLRRIGMQLGAEGIPTPSGKLTNWALGTLRTILNNPAYMGRYEALRWSVGKHAGRQMRPAEQRVVIPCPALVSEALYEAVQARLRENKQWAPRNNRNVETYLLRAGFVRCGVCGRKMTATTNGPRRLPAYACSNLPGQNALSGCPLRVRIYAERADTAVRAYVRGLFMDEGRIRRELERLIGEDPTRDDLASVDRAAKSTLREEANLTAALAKLNPAAQAPVIARLNQIAQQRQELDAERERVLGRRESWVEAIARMERVEQWAGQIAAKLDTATYAQWREILFACGVEVRILPATTKERIEIKAEIDLDQSTLQSSSPTSGPYCERQYS
jgi:site-specific DNA recombinase